MLCLILTENGFSMSGGTSFSFNCHDIPVDNVVDVTVPDIAAADVASADVAALT